LTAPLRILITNNSLKYRAGSELYVRDIATSLLARGHTPISYSTTLGEVARELRLATIPVIDDLESLAVTPDIIHGQHHLETMTALLRFPGVPAIYFCHGWIPWEEAPPSFPRILRYVAVDNTCRDRLVYEHAIPEERIRVLLNFVDLERFKARSPLPEHPSRALVFSNNASEQTHLSAIRDACDRAGIKVDSIGISTGNVVARPESVLGEYDIIFAKGRAALESMAVGAAVVLCDSLGVGPLVTASELDHLRPLNFGIRALSEPVSAEAISIQISRYDPNDAAEVSRRIRATAGREPAVDRLELLYEEVIAEFKAKGKGDENEELLATSRYLRSLGPRLKDQTDAARSWVESQLAAKEAEIAMGQSEMQAARAWLVTKDSELEATKAQLADTVARLNHVVESLAWRTANRFGPLKNRVERRTYNLFRRLFGSDEERK
jgi:Glycosyltransferase Family 4